MQVEAFEWCDAERGQRIEDFVHDTTCQDPRLMQEVLKLGFGDLRWWTDTGVVVGAKCGCLVGSCAIAAARLGRVDAMKFNANPYTVVPMTLAEALSRGNEYRAHYIREIGEAVANEVYESDTADDERNAAVSRYLTDLIATDLRLLGLRVPKRAAE